MSSIATELTQTIQNNPTTRETRGNKKDITTLETRGNKKDITTHPVTEASKEISDNVGRELITSGSPQTLTVKITTDAAKILDAAAAEEEQV